MRWTGIPMLLTVAVIAAGAFAGPQAVPNAFPVEKTERRLHDQLEQPITVEFDRQPLQEVLAAIKESTGVHIYPKWQPLTADRIGPDSRVSMTLTDVPARKVLMLAMDVVSAGLADTDYEVADRYVFVSTTESLNHKVKRRSYNLRQMLKWHSGGDTVDEFVKLIEGTVYPGVWASQGSNQSHAIEKRKGFWVIGSRNVHRGIGVLLTAFNDKSKNRKWHPLLTGQTQAWQKTDESLYRTVTFEAEKQPLEEVLARLRADFKLNIFLYWYELNRLGIRLGTEVSIDIEDEPLIEVIRSITRQLSRDDSPVDALVDEDGVILIGPVSRLDRRKQVRLYDVKGVEKAEQAMAKIKQQIAPKSWETGGMEGSAIFNFNGVLVVRAPLSTHLQIDDMLHGPSEAEKRAAEKKNKQKKQAGPKDKPKRKPLKRTIRTDKKQPTPESEPDSGIPGL